MSYPQEALREDLCDSAKNISDSITKCLLAGICGEASTLNQDFIKQISPGWIHSIDWIPARVQILRVSQAATPVPYLFSLAGAGAAQVSSTMTESK